MGRKRGSLSPRISRSGRNDSRPSSFGDRNPDDGRQNSLRGERTLSRKLSYNLDARLWLPQDQFKYLMCEFSKPTVDWQVVGDILQDLVRNQEDDPLKSLLLPNTPYLTDMLHSAVMKGEERVVKLLTDRDLVDINSPKYATSFLDAAEGGYAAIMTCLLRHFKNYPKMSSIRFRQFLNMADSSNGTPNTALHFACGEGRLAVLKELLEEFLHDLELNVINSERDTPLHVAITTALRTKDLESFDLLCTKGKKKLLMNKKGKEGKTPSQRLWEVMMSTDNTEEERDTAELMKQLFLKQKPVNDRREESYREREYLQTVATSLLVGATLLVGIAFGGFLQMPKLPPDEHFFEPGATVFNKNSDLGSRKYWYIRAIDIFRCTNAISFFMSIISIVFSIRVMISRRDKAFIDREVCELERSSRVASIALTLATAVAVVAFVSGGLANIPVAESGWSRVISGWQKHEYIPLYKSTTLMTSLLGSLCVAPIVVSPLAKDYYFFWQEFLREKTSGARVFSLVFSTCLIFTVLLLVVMVVFGMGLL